MLTQCPVCSTHFRLHPEQLLAAGGRVRCGRCGCLFNARPAQHTPPTGLPALEAPVDFIPPRGPDPKPNGRLFWGLGALLLCAGLLVQAAWWDRHDLAQDPDTMTWIQQACAHLPCKLEAARSTQHIKVLDRALDTHPSQTGAMRFTLHMVNRWDRPQAYPRLELSLLDRNGSVAGIRRFEPDSYLPNIQPGSLMEQNKSVEIILDLKDTGTPIAGFRIDFL